MAAGRLKDSVVVPYDETQTVSGGRCGVAFPLDSLMNDVSLHLHCRAARVSQVAF
jgi:hypothetical protein